MCVSVGSTPLGSSQFNFDMLAGQQSRVVPGFCDFILLAHCDNSILIHIKHIIAICYGWQHTKNSHVNDTGAYQMQVRECSDCMIRVMVSSIMLKFLIQLLLHWASIWTQSHKTIWYLSRRRIRPAAVSESSSSDVQIWFRVSVYSQ